MTSKRETDTGPDHRPAGLTDILDSLDAACGDSKRMTIGDVVTRFENRGFGPLLLVPSLLVLLPTGAVPGVPTIMALCIILIAGQMLLGRSSPWLPNRLERMAVKRRTVHRTTQTARRYTTAIDRHLHPRFAWFTSTVARRLVAALCLALAVVMIPLEVVPFAAAVPALCMVLLSLGLTTEDGRLVIASLVCLLLGVALALAIL